MRIAWGISGRYVLLWRVSMGLISLASFLDTFGGVLRCFQRSGHALYYADVSRRLKSKFLID